MSRRLLDELAYELAYALPFAQVPTAVAGLLASATLSYFVPERRGQEPRGSNDANPCVASSTFSAENSMINYGLTQLYAGNG